MLIKTFPSGNALFSILHITCFFNGIYIWENLFYPLKQCNYVSNTPFPPNYSVTKSIWRKFIQKLWFWRKISSSMHCCKYTRSDTMRCIPSLQPCTFTPCSHHGKSDIPKSPDINWQIRTFPAVTQFGVSSSMFLAVYRPIWSRKCGCATTSVRVCSV